MKHPPHIDVTASLQYPGSEMSRNRGEEQLGSMAEQDDCADGNAIVFPFRDMHDKRVFRVG